MSKHPTFHKHVFDDDNYVCFYKHDGLSLGPTLYYDEDHDLQQIMFENHPYDSNTYEICFSPHHNPSINHITHTRYSYSSTQVEPHKEILERYSFDVNNVIDLHNYTINHYEVMLVNKYTTSDKYARDAERNHHSAILKEKKETITYSHKYKNMYSGIQLSFYKDTNHLHVLSCYKDGVRQGYTLLFDNQYNGCLQEAHYYHEGVQQFRLGNYAHDMQSNFPHSPSYSPVSSVSFDSN